MNIVKPLIILAAMSITAAGMAGIITYSNATAIGSHQGIKATNDVIQTLPTIHVYPSREQMRELHKARQEGAAPTDPTMPFYSYADAAGA